MYIHIMGSKSTMNPIPAKHAGPMTVNIVVCKYS